MRGGKSGGGAILKCALTMARVAVGRLQSRHEALGDMRRNRENDFVRGAERQHMPSPKSRALARPSAKADGAQPMLETDLHAALGQIIERRIDEGRR